MRLQRAASQQVQVARRGAIVLVLAACGGVVSTNSPECLGPRGARICGGPTKCTGCPTVRVLTGTSEKAYKDDQWHDVPNCGIDAVHNTPAQLNGPPSTTLPKSGGYVDNDARVCIPADKVNEWSSGGDISELPRHACVRCGDGNLCFLTDPRTLDGFGPQSVFDLLVCGDEAYGTLLAKAGHADMVRYADRSAYTGEALPTPETCPSFPGLSLCGGACGSCGPGATCLGRSPLHPYSICVPNSPALDGVAQCGQYVKSCSGDPYNRPVSYSCLVFKVDDASQPLADSSGLCAPDAICQAAAQYYPGGAYCRP